MNNGKLVVWGMGFGIFGVSSFVGCAPTITVSRDDAGAAGVGDSGGSLGGGPGANGGDTGVGGTDLGVGAAPVSDGGSSGRAGTGGTDALGNGGSGGTGTVVEPDGCPCSRRPSSPVSRDCPRGISLSVTDTIGPDGGELTLSHTQSTIGAPFKVKLFPGSLEVLTTFKLSETTLSPPIGLFDVSPVYRVESSVDAFGNGGEVTVPWTVPSGSVPQGIAVYFAESPDGPWTPIEDSYTNAGFEQATITSPGYFIAAYPPPPELASCPAGRILDFSTVNCGATDPEQLFTNTCAKSFCHGRNFVAGLDLRTDPGLAMRLLDVPATFSDVPCADDVTRNCIPDTCPTGALLVDSANPEASWMLSKLTVATRACGDLMPPSDGAKTADYPCFRAIIEAIAGLQK
ncbi:MAG TPA: hypothetical protein VNN72_23540 [Polyangiaceae bacterium]|nr:hypothetical protein [Polyangiaceae bacterium]